MNPTLPPGLKAYKRTLVFDQETLPAGLRREHRTKAGVWALIHVVEGRLRYRVLEPLSEIELMPGGPGVVQPNQPHEVEPIGVMRMYVEFFAEERSLAWGDRERAGRWNGTKGEET